MSDPLLDVETTVAAAVDAAGAGPVTFKKRKIKREATRVTGGEDDAALAEGLEAPAAAAASTEGDGGEEEGLSASQIKRQIKKQRDDSSLGVVAESTKAQKEASGRTISASVTSETSSIFAKKGDSSEPMTSNTLTLMAIAEGETSEDPHKRATAKFMRQAQNIRTNSYVEYQMPICKDFQETGRCGYGDSCKFMHDRFDYKSGTRAEREFDAKQKRKLARIAAGGSAADSDDDDEAKKNNKSGGGLPDACPICHGPFQEPVQTVCYHYFCERCALQHFAKNSKCFECGTKTGGIFNTATQLIRVLKEREKERERESKAAVKEGEQEEEERGRVGIGAASKAASSKQGPG